MHIPYDSDFDAPIKQEESARSKVIRGQSIFDAFSGSVAFAIGIVTAFLALGAIGFFVLLAFIL